MKYYNAFTKQSDKMLYGPIYWQANSAFSSIKQAMKNKSNEANNDQILTVYNSSPAS